MDMKAVAQDVVEPLDRCVEADAIKLVVADAEDLDDAIGRMQELVSYANHTIGALRALKDPWVRRNHGLAD